MNGPLGKDINNGGQNKPSLQNVLGGDRVTDIYEMSAGGQLEHHPLERGHVGADRAEIGRERKNPRRHHAYQPFKWPCGAAQRPGGVARATCSIFETIFTCGWPHRRR